MKLKPFEWKDRPALIEHLFPVQKLSVESFKEQMAGAGKTLVGLGGYWKGRKPLILNKACIIGSLLPATGDLKKDLEIFEMLLGMDRESLEIRLIEKSAKQADFFKMQERTENYHVKYVDYVRDACRPEECGTSLFCHIWNDVNDHLGTDAFSFSDLVEEIGVARFGRRPKVADTFCGSGQIPFEAARLGCEVYASDLNPIAAMLTWGAFNIVGANHNKREFIEQRQQEIANEVRKEMDSLGFERNEKGWVPKVYLYCVEIICPESGWRVPLLPTLVVSSKNYKVIAVLVPVPTEKRYDIQIKHVNSAEEFETAKTGTIQDGVVTHSPDGEKTYRVKISTLRGDYIEGDENKNKLSLWGKNDFLPREDDIFQERLYCILWMKNKAKGKGKDLSFSSITTKDIEHENKLVEYISSNFYEWQKNGIIPDMKIESGYNTDQPIRERGWTHWHHLFNPRQLLSACLVRKRIDGALSIPLARLINQNSRLSRWDPASGGGGCVQAVFDNQALNTLYNYGCRAISNFEDLLTKVPKNFPFGEERYTVNTHPAESINIQNDIYITDPPYGDAVKYEEITEFFIAWLRKNPPPEFAHWTWDSRRALAIKGEDEGFRQGMIAAYRKMGQMMPDNGIQVLMFTHQSGAIWADMANIVWAAGLQVTAAWYVVTETDSALRQGANVTGTVMLVLRKRLERKESFRDELGWEIEDAVKKQVESLTGLDKSVREEQSEGLYNDADIQMAGYAAALRVLTTYAVIDGKEMETEATAPRKKGVKSFVDELIDFAVQTAVQFLVPIGFEKEQWQKLAPIERYYLKMVDMEAQSAKTLDNYQNFAKAFRVHHFDTLMASSKANSARLLTSDEFKAEQMSGTSEIAKTPLRSLLYAMHEIQKDVEIEDVIAHLMDNCEAGYLQLRPILIIMADFLAVKREGLKPEKLYDQEASAARVLAEALRNQRL